jgi:hypothetical protein
MNCLTCNNKGLIPDLTAAIDGERISEFEICPDCKGESRYQNKIGKRDKINHQERQEIIEEGKPSSKMAYLLRSLIPACFGNMRFNVNKGKKENAIRDYIEALKDIAGGAFTEKFKKRIYKKLYVYLYDPTCNIL